MSDASEDLCDAAVLWVLDGRYERVVDAAVACIMADASTSEVDILAGSSPIDPYSERLAMVTAALDSLGLPPVPTDPDKLAREGARIVTRSVARGDLSENDISSWLSGRLSCEVRSRVETALDEVR